MNTKFIPALLALAVASGCTTYKDKQSINGYSEDYDRITRDQVHSSSQSVTLDAKIAAQDVNRPFITGAAIPLARDVTLPSPLRANVDTTLLFKYDGDLVTQASKVQETTGIPVKVAPDALLPVEYFLPRLTDQDKNGRGMGQGAIRATAAPVVLDSPLPGVGAPLPGMPDTPMLPQMTRDATGKLKEMGRQPLATALDAIALKNGVYWKWDPTIAAILFFRTETRTFEVRGVEMNASGEMSVDLSGGVDNKNSTGLNSKSKAYINVDSAKGGALGSMVERMTQFMTRSGTIAAGSGGLVVVTDTKGALDQIEDYVKRENTFRTRRVDLVFEEITVEKTDGNQAGVNWNLAFNTAAAGGTTEGLNSLLEQEGAAFSLGLTANRGPFAGSSLAVQALAKVGRVVDVKTNNFGSVNGQPATTGRPARQKYIDKLEQTQATSDSSRPTVTVTQGEEVYGRILTVLPYAYADGDINMAIKFDNTATPVLTKQTLPDGSYVQSPQSNGDVLVRTAIVHSGQPYVISAQTLDSSSYDERRTDHALPIALGGSDVTSNSKLVNVFVVTARVRE